VSPVLHGVLYGLAIWIAFNGLAVLLWVAANEIAHRHRLRVVRARVRARGDWIDLTRPRDRRLP
jgi:hypothetical protein